MERVRGREQIRAVGRTVECPKCQAKVGEPCWRKNGNPRKALHSVRYLAKDDQMCGLEWMSPRILGRWRAMEEERESADAA